MFQATQPIALQAKLLHINTNGNNYQLAVHFMQFEYEHERSVIYSALQEPETKST